MHLPLALTLTSVKFKIFQELQGRATIRSFSLSVFVAFTKPNELRKKVINHKQRKAFQAGHSKLSRQVDYKACSNSFLGLAVDVQEANRFVDVLLTVNNTSSYSLLDHDKSF